MAFSAPTDPSPAPLDLILILMWQKDEHYDFINACRTEYYPPDLLWNPAHISLFTRLTVPSHLLARVNDDISQASSHQAPFTFTLKDKPKLWHKFVVLPVQSWMLLSVRQRLRNRLVPLGVLGRQEINGYNPHVTIHGRVSAKEARSVFLRAEEALSAELGAHLCGSAVGLQLCEFHEGQPWRVLRSFPFTGS